MLTVDDIRNPARKSGFDYVGRAGGSHVLPWRAHGTRVAPRPGQQFAVDWRGPTRASAYRAAQDYVDYVNNGGSPPAASLARVKRKKPQVERRQISHREREARKVIRDELTANPPTALHEPVCYLVGVKMDMLAVKVGHADYNVHSRLDSLQTGNPRELVLLGTLPGGQETENKLHAKYAKFNRLGEWFTPDRALLREFGLSPRDYRQKVR